MMGIRFRVLFDNEHAGSLALGEGARSEGGTPILSGIIRDLDVGYWKKVNTKTEPYY